MLKTTESFDYNVDPLTYDHMDVHATVITKFIGDTDIGLTVTLFSDTKEVRKNTLIVPRQCVEAILECLSEFDREYLLPRRKPD